LLSLIMERSSKISWEVSMGNKGRYVIVGLVVLAAFLLLPGSGSAAEGNPVMACPGLMNMTKLFLPGATITSAKMVPASAGLPEHCRVDGWRWPDDGFIVKLPSAWNGRLFQIGNGAAAGAIREEDMALGLAKGFATAAGTGGHRSPDTLFQFGYFAGDPAAYQKVIDHCSGSVHATNGLARKMIKAYYGVPLAYAYYVGYSTGGRQGLMEAQRYPDDFDGLLAGGDPAPFTVRTMLDTWVSTQLLGASYIPHAKLPLLAQAVAAKCDGIDGLVDGLIDDPRKCSFNAMTDLPACAGDADGPNCFTRAQRQAVYNIYRGPENSAGTLLAKGVSYGSEAIMADGQSGWTMFVPPVPGGGTFTLGLGSSFVKWVGLPPVGGGPNWDWKTFDVNRDWDVVRNNWGEACDTNDPDLRAFKAKGKKFIDYHGWADALCWPYRAVDYYDEVVKKIGSLEETRNFYRLYMIPAMTHFPGGRSVVDRNTIREPFFSALQDWVEKGREPGAFVGSRRAVPEKWDAITRPVCPYPEVARYNGVGSTDAAENFTCVKPSP
jgi:feruloyl esterase